MRKQLVLVILVIIFVFPSVAAYFLYKNSALINLPKTNKGLLLESPILVGDKSPNRRWQLWFWTKKPDSESAQNALSKLARVRLALGRKLYHLDLKLVLPLGDFNVSDSLSKQLAQYDVGILGLNDNQSKILQNLLRDNKRFFLIDHNGYLVLAYSPKVQSEDLYRDLSKLLKD